MKEELIEMMGVVVDKQPNAFFKVQLNGSDHMVLATISGRMRRNRIRILMGDRVDIELSPYDLTKVRITYRHKEIGRRATTQLLTAPIRKPATLLIV